MDDVIQALMLSQEAKLELVITRGKSLLELWVTTFLPDWQPPLIFVQFISNSMCMCYDSVDTYYSVDSAHVILK